MTTEIFVSYSHQDDKYLHDNSLLGYLKILERDGAASSSDTKIKTGSAWERVIKQRIDAADIVLALVTQMFLVSDFCQNIEIASFLKRSRDSGLIIFPVIISACSWKQFDWLRERQFFLAMAKILKNISKTRVSERHFFNRSPKLSENM